jgi:preprotein translocase subunit SecE
LKCKLGVGLDAEAYVAEPEKVKKENALVAYLRSTRAELRKVRWPTLEQGWSMTKIVLIVTVAMAIFLGVLDFAFGWLLSGVIRGELLFTISGIVIVLALLGAAYWISRGEEA